MSVDSWASHKVFREQLGLPFDLLSDWDRDISKKYGAFDEVEMVSTRKSFLVDKEGVVRFTQEAILTKPENDKTASKYRVYLTPTFVIADSEGKEIDRLIGEVPRKTLETFIDKNLAKKKEVRRSNIFLGFV